MSLLIKNVRVLGSSKHVPERADVFVSGEVVSAIGNFPKKSADKVIDGQGSFLSPGFIDIDSSSDHYLTLFEDPGQEEFLLEGVTTTIGGHCGASLAPLLYGTLESIKKWANIRATNVGWRTIGELLNVLKKKRLGVNFGTFAGHSTIRRSITGDVIRDLTGNEMKVFEGVLEKALAEGAFGLSLGLEYIHTRSTPYSELKEFSEKLAAKKKILSVHLRHSGSGIKSAVEEVLKLNRETGVAVLITHFLPQRGSEKEFSEALELLDKLPGDTPVHFSLSPFPWRTLPLYRILPDWAQNGDFTLMVKSVEDAWLSKRVMKDFGEISPEGLVVEEAPYNPAFQGRTLGQIMDITGKSDFRESLMELMRATRLQAVVSVEDISLPVLKQALAHRKALIGSHLPSFSSGTFHFRRAFTEFLKMAGENPYAAEEAVRRLSATPAKFLNLPHRGELTEGSVADLVVFKEGNIQNVVVAGSVAVENGEPVKVSAGKIMISANEELS